MSRRMEGPRPAAPFESLSALQTSHGIIIFRSLRWKGLMAPHESRCSRERRKLRCGEVPGGLRIERFIPHQCLLWVSLLWPVRCDREVDRSIILRYCQKQPEGTEKRSLICTRALPQILLYTTSVVRLSEQCQGRQG